MGGGLFQGFRTKSLDEVACKGDVGKLRKMVGRGANVNQPSPDPKLFGRLPIHAATAFGHVQMVETLATIGADVDIQDMQGRTALHYAVQHRQNHLIPVLLDCGADYTLRDIYKRMPIHLASEVANGEARELLLGRALDQSMEFEFFDQGHWCPFDEAASRMLGFELGDGAGFAALSLGPEANYIVDFEERIQLNVSSLFLKSVAWRVLPAGRWSRPRAPVQGLHPGSQDPRLLRKYDTLLRSMQSQGVAVCQLYFQLHQEMAQPGQGTSPMNLSLPGHLRNSSGSHGGWVEGEPAGGEGGVVHVPPMLPRSPSAPPPSGPLQWPEAAQYMPSEYNLPPGHAGASSAAPSEPCTPLQRTRQEEPGIFELPPAAGASAVGPAFAAGAAGGAMLASSASFSSQAPRMVPSVSVRDAVVVPEASVEVVTLQVLRSGSEEYNEVAARFLRGMEKRATSASGRPMEGEEIRPVTVSSITRVKLPWDRVEPFAKARSGLRARRGSDNVRRAWHGAPKPALESILQEGFVLSPHGRNGRLFGDGIYLAPEDYARTSAEFATPDSSGVKHMLLCVVALGAQEQVPFESTQRRPSNVMRFDTGVDRLDGPTRYIVWEEDMNDYILPTHLLSFRYC